MLNIKKKNCKCYRNSRSFTNKKQNKEKKKAEAIHLRKQKFKEKLPTCGKI